MTIKEKIALFPHQSGVYRYYDADGNIIYVGKAKDLHKRVAQYFVPKERLTRKTAIMVSKIADAQYSVVESEADELLLENNLIKQYKRISAPCGFYGVYYFTGHCAYVGFAVTSDFRFVMHAAQRNARKFSAHAFRNCFAN